LRRCVGDLKTPADRGHAPYVIGTAAVGAVAFAVERGTLESLAVARPSVRTGG
jgi:hypothetical protein